MNLFRPILAILFYALLSASATAQSCYWQQEANYLMDVHMDVKKNQFTGTQKIVYTNNSPDELDKLFYHLYFNAFQPNSMMDVRSRTILDTDRRVGDRIANLAPEEMGNLKVTALTVRGKKVKMEHVGTILEVDLEDPIKPGEKVMLDMTFEGQVPLQIRRSGRDNKEGIRYSMSQWYPKLCEYDENGWHATSYVGREFHGIWGDFDVTINIDSDYILGATGVLQNPDEIGYGYGKEPKKRPKTLAWRFKGDNIIDFVWAADPDYVHDKVTTDEGVVLHFLYQPGEATTENWKKLQPAMTSALKFINKTYGTYPYPVYSFIQGGDGGMEYPMATLITGERSFGSLVGVAVHEWMHSWYHMMLATNESKYPWMDEGFTSFGSAYTEKYLAEEGILHEHPGANPMAGAIIGFTGWIQSGRDEPISTHADYFNTNAAYGVGSYNKGSIYLEQLKYIMGEYAFNNGMLKYFDEWKFKHPNPTRFLRVMEKESGLELDWYNEFWVNTTKYPDYAIDSVGNDFITLANYGDMPMPVELVVTHKSGKKDLYYIPLRVMRGEKTFDSNLEVTTLEDWPWTHKEYTIDIPTKDVIKVEINPENNFVDRNRVDNVWPQKKAKE